MFSSHKRIAALVCRMSLKRDVTSGYCDTAGARDALISLTAKAA